MSDEKLLTVRDASLVLGLSEKEIIALAEEGALPSQKIDGAFLRFQRNDLLEFLKSSNPALNHKASPLQDGSKERFLDFFYLNDFYLVSGLIIVILLIVIFHGY